MRALASAKSTIVAVAVVAVCCGPRVSAEESRPAYQLSVALDVPLLLVGGALASSYLLMDEAAPPACAPLCDKANVNAFDRPFAGNYSESWQRVGDITTISTLVLVPLTLVLGEPSRAVLGDLLVVGETALLTSAVQVMSSYAFTRARPRVYGVEAPLDQRDDSNAGRSFFSGHVANTLAVTVATTTTLRRLGRPGLGWVALSIGVAGSALLGVARVGAGGHFPSDVLIGYAVGAGIGIAVPALHEAHVGVAPLAIGQSGGLAISGSF